jgi:hypothetical protein
MKSNKSDRLGKQGTPAPKPPRKTAEPAPASNGNGEAIPDPAPAPSPAPSPAPVPDGAPAVPSPYSVEALRLPVDYTPTKRVLTRIPHDKPNKSWFIRVHPDPAYRITVGVIELRGQSGGIGKELFLVAPALCEHLAQREACFAIKLLVTAISSQGILFLWETNLPRVGDRENTWVTSSLEAIARAEKVWVRVVPKIEVGGYELTEPVTKMPEPEWPALTLAEMLEISFKGAVISDLGHPVLKRLRGEA